jgi:hypothetical protein
MIGTGSTRVSNRARQWSVVALSMFAVVACGGDDDSDGVLTCAEINPQCTPAFDPTWDNVHRFVISKSCAAEGPGCHGSQGKQGGLDMSSQMAAYEGLVNGVGGKPRVMKGDASCSVLTERIETDDANKRMPKLGQKLPDGDRCAIEKWIAAGAPQ